MSTIDIDELLAPISGDNPSGVDISFDPVYDAIKEARRADAAYLSQGDWKTSIKMAEWGKVKQLSCEVLAKRSKDLQVTCWLIEALTHLYGFAGLVDGLTLLNCLLNQYWQTLYPQPDGDDIELRIGRILWLDNTLPLALAQLPLTAPIAESKGYSWIRWKQSRDVDNLARQSVQAQQEALQEGKINSEMWELGYRQTPAAFYEALLTEVSAAQQALATLNITIEQQFANEAPRIHQLNDILAQIHKLITKLALDKGIGTANHLVVAAPATIQQEANTLAATLSTTILSRDEALRRLHDVADYFRAAEPHSPVAYLVDKAVKWGNMRLDEWLREVVQDTSTRERLRDLLGYADE